MLPNLAALTLHSTAPTEVRIKVPRKPDCKTLVACRALLLKLQARLVQETERMREFGRRNLSLKHTKSEMLVKKYTRAINRLLDHIRNLERDDIADNRAFALRLELDQKIDEARMADEQVMLQWIDWDGHFERVYSEGPWVMRINCPAEFVTMMFTLEYSDYSRTIEMRMRNSVDNKACVEFMYVNWPYRGQGKCFYLKSLFYGVGEDRKENCLMSPPYNAAMASTRKRAYTNAVFKTFDVIASVSGVDGALEDASTFTNRPPYKAFLRMTRRLEGEGVPMTRTLAATRGWGY